MADDTWKAKKVAVSDPRMPYWPAALNKKMAAAYCGLSSETFDKVCPVAPIRMTDSSRGERYLRQRIDEWLLSIDPNNEKAAAKRSFGDRLSAAHEAESPTKRRRARKDS